MRDSDENIRWLTSSFAPEWYADALKEARQGRDHHARRREIIFAVCCVESYLFEWVRDLVLDRQYRDVAKYFPDDDRRGIRTRWKDVVKMLYSDGLIVAVPDFGMLYWNDFLKLVDFRDGLVHGKSSRPSSKSQEESKEPLPSKNELDRMESGWATKTVARTIKELHAAAGGAIPEWLIEP